MQNSSIDKFLTASESEVDIKVIAGGIFMSGVFLLAMIGGISGTINHRIALKKKEREMLLTAEDVGEFQTNLRVYQAELTRASALIKQYLIGKKRSGITISLNTAKQIEKFASTRPDGLSISFIEVFYDEYRKLDEFKYLVDYRSDDIPDINWDMIRADVLSDLRKMQRDLSTKLQLRYFNLNLNYDADSAVLSLDFNRVLKKNEKLLKP